MKKIILLTFILFLNQAWGSSMPTSYYSTTNYAVMNSVITSTLMTMYLSEHNRNRVYRKLNQCIKYKGGDACFKKFGIKENKLSE